MAIEKGVLRNRKTVWGREKNGGGWTLFVRWGGSGVKENDRQQGGLTWSLLQVKVGKERWVFVFEKGV